MAQTQDTRYRDLTPIQRVALTRLRRFERVAAVARESGSPLWRRLAEQTAAGAMRDVVLLGLAPAAAHEPALRAA